MTTEANYIRAEGDARRAWERACEALEQWQTKERILKTLAEVALADAVANNDKEAKRRVRKSISLAKRCAIRAGTLRTRMNVT